MAGLIYEVNLSVDKTIVDAFDEWLSNHVQEMLEQPAFVRAEVYELDDDDDGRARRVTHYFVEDVALLDEYLAGPARQMRQDGIDRFGEQFSASRRILSSSDLTAKPAAALAHCLNCGQRLGGQYCANCGQRARSRLISLWELLSDAFGDLFELDSRLWQTLLPLLARPGKLTRDYLEGRRARYMPPFRTYLVLSIIFLFVALFDPREKFGIFFEPEPAPGATETETADAPRQSAEEVRNEILQELRDEGILVDTGEPDAAVAGTDDAPDARSPPDSATKVEAGDDEERLVRVSIDDDEGGCDDIGANDTLDLPPWLARRLTPERLAAVCEKIEADRGKSLGEKLVDSIPAALFVLLPLMAFVLKLLYPLSKRYYVEHLLFVMHYHAFVFLVLVLMLTFAALVGFLGLPEAVATVVIVAGSIYIPVYLYKSMRRVYLQGHLATVPKYALLIVAYFMGLFSIAAVTVLLAAFSI